MVRAGMRGNAQWTRLSDSRFDANYVNFTEPVKDARMQHGIAIPGAGTNVTAKGLIRPRMPTR
jgi:hypothetical protein